MSTGTSGSITIPSSYLSTNTKYTLYIHPGLNLPAYDSEPFTTGDASGNGGSAGGGAPSGSSLLDQTAH